MQEDEREKQAELNHIKCKPTGLPDILISGSMEGGKEGVSSTVESVYNEHGYNELSPIAKSFSRMDFALFK